MPPTLGVMVLNRNGRDWLPPLYRSLRDQGYGGLLRVYLVDNASTDGSVELTRDSFPEVRVIRFSENLGYCIAYNRAMPVAFADGCDFVIWANNDVLLEPGCLSELAAVPSGGTRVGVIGPAFLAWDSDEPNYYMRGMHPQAIPAMQGREPDPIDVEWVEGSFLMVSAECVRDVGWLDPFLFFYWEETDFCRRAARKGWRVVLAPRAVARHFAGGWSSGNAKNAEAANHLKSRNYYIYTLANPNRDFTSNLVAFGHQFLVHVKAATRVSPRKVAYELSEFWRLLPELGAIRKKWARDRAGDSPEVTTAAYSRVTMLVEGQDGLQGRDGSRGAAG